MTERELISQFSKRPTPPHSEFDGGRDLMGFAERQQFVDAAIGPGREFFEGVF
jgi:hypothetical protein